MHKTTHAWALHEMDPDVKAYRQLAHEVFNGLHMLKCFYCRKKKMDMMVFGENYMASFFYIFFKFAVHVG